MLTNLEFENLGGLIGVEKLNSSLKFSGTLASKSAGDIIDSQMHLLSSLHTENSPNTPQISLAAAARDILVNFEISLAVFIPNTPRNRAIFYTYSSKIEAWKPHGQCTGLRMEQSGFKPWPGTFRYCVLGRQDT